MTRAEIFEVINDEREYQDKRWGTEFDYKNTMNDWISYITRYLGKAQVLDRNAGLGEFRQNMFKVAALAVAALEQDGYAARHYDT